jgi:hypothetical protein
MNFLYKFREVKDISQEFEKNILDDVYNMSYSDAKNKLESLCMDLWMTDDLISNKKTLEYFKAIQYLIRKYEFLQKHAEYLKEQGATWM